MSYESPINVNVDLAKQVADWNDNQIVAQIRMHVDVNKDELVKALAYDRHQYEKGYADAKKELETPQGRWLPEGGPDWTGYQCNRCGDHALEIDGVEIRSKFCPHCGAKMEV